MVKMGRCREPVSRRAHNPKIVSSILTTATQQKKFRFHVFRSNIQKKRLED